MATATKKQTWQDLQPRGGPYSPEEMQVLYDRPGMSKIGGHAWACETCDRIIGMHNSAQLEEYYRSKGTLKERVRPTPPQHIQELAARAEHCEQVYRGVTNDLGAAYAERAKIEQEEERQRYQSSMAPEGVVRQSESPRDKAIRTARLQEVNARIDRLKQAQEESLIARAEPLNEYMQAFAQWREEVRQEEERANRVAAGLEADPQPKVSQLERWLSGRKSA